MQPDVVEKANNVVSNIVYGLKVIGIVLQPNPVVQAAKVNNQRGELLALKVTPGNVDDSKRLLAIASSLFGKLYADKGYIVGKEFAQKMKGKGIDVVTRVRKNMKKIVHSEFDWMLPRKRSLLETVFDELKNLCQIEHT